MSTATAKAAPVVDLELAMDGVPDFALVRKWIDLLQKAGFKNVRARASSRPINLK